MDAEPNDKPSIDDRDAFIRWQLKEMQALNARAAERMKLAEAQPKRRSDDTNSALLALLNRMDQKLDDRVRPGTNGHS